MARMVGMPAEGTPAAVEVDYACILCRTMATPATKLPLAIVVQSYDPMATQNSELAAIKAQTNALAASLKPAPAVASSPAYACHASWILNSPAGIWPGRNRYPAMR